MLRSHVAFVRPVLSYAVDEGFYREDVLVWELRGTVSRPICGVHPMEHFPGLIEYSLGRPIIDIITTAFVQRCPSFQKQCHNFQPITRRLLRVGVQKANRESKWCLAGISPGVHVRARGHGTRRHGRATYARRARRAACRRCRTYAGATSARVGARGRACAWTYAWGGE